LMMLLAFGNDPDARFVHNQRKTEVMHCIL